MSRSKIIQPSKPSGIVTPDGRELESSGPQMDSLPRILIATSFYDNIRPIFFKSLDNLFEGHGVAFHAEKLLEQTSAVDMFRNRAIELGLQHNFDYVFFVDSDMGFPQFTTLGMLATFEHEAAETVYITSGLYNIRRQGFVNAVYNWNGESFDDVNSNTDSDFKLNSVYKADAAGTGCMMIDLKLFADKADQLEYPWFQYWYKPMTASGKPVRWSEDLVFGRKMSEIGVHTFVNTSIICDHEIRGASVHQTDGSEYSVFLYEGLSVQKENGDL